MSMRLNWTSVTAHHVKQACDALHNSGSQKPRLGGLVVDYRGKQLPAKAVLRLAYCLANKIDAQTPFKFASGEGSLKLLRALGFQAERSPISGLVGKKE
jgi:hypothetical protein